MPNKQIAAPEKQETRGGGTGLIAFVAIALIGGGAAWWYLKNKAPGNVITSNVGKIGLHYSFDYQGPAQDIAVECLFGDYIANWFKSRSDWQFRSQLHLGAQADSKTVSGDMSMELPNTDLGLFSGWGIPHTYCAEITLRSPDGSQILGDLLDQMGKTRVVLSNVLTQQSVNNQLQLVVQSGSGSIV